MGGRALPSERGRALSGCDALGWRSDRNVYNLSRKISGGDPVPLDKTRLPDHVADLPACSRGQAQALLALDQRARERGVRLCPQSDFSLLADVLRREAESGARLGPAFDASHHRLSPDRAHWVAGLDEDDRVVMTAATRIFDWRATSLREEAQSLRLFGPGPFSASRFSGAAAGAIRGRVSVTGCGWVHPRFRGPGRTGVKLSQILRRAAAFLACARQPVDFDCGWVRTHQVVEKGLAADYGFDHLEHGADFVVRDGSLSANTLVWSDAGDLDRDVDSCGRGDLRRPQVG